MGDLIQFRPKHPSSRVNDAANRAFWMGRTGMDGKGAMLSGPHAGTLPYRDDDGIWCRGPDDLTMSHADPEMEYEAPSGDCA